MTDPGGFPGTSGRGEPADRPQTARNIDPWGEHGPTDQYEADTALSPRQGRELLRFPTFGDPDLAPIEFADSYARLAASTAAQLSFVEELIVEQYGTEGMGGLVGKEMQATVTGPVADQSVEMTPTGKESLRSLIQWQGELRRDLAKILVDGMKIGIKARQADLVRRYGEWVATSMENLSAELGVNWEDPATRRAAQRAVLRTRARLGIGATSPDAAGPALDDAERARVGLTSGPAGTGA